MEETHYRIQEDEDSEEKVRRYAKHKGVRVPRARRDLIDAGLEAEGDSDE